jgi:zinc protease
MTKKTGSFIKILTTLLIFAVLPVQASNMTIAVPSAQFPEQSQLLSNSQGFRFSSDKGFMEQKLNNGLRVIIEERQGTGIAAAEFIIKVGSMEQMDTYAGIASVIQQLILRSIVPETGLSLQESAEEEGCFISAVSEADYVRISMLATKDIFQKNFLRVVNMIKNPDFSPELLEDIKSEVIHGIDNRQNALSMIHEFFLREFYRYHPYRIPTSGIKSTVERLTPETIKGFYDRFYSADRITVSVAGDVFGPDLMDLIRKNLSDLPRHPQKQVTIPWEPVAQEKRLQLVTTSNIAWLFVGFPAPSVKSPDYPKMLVLNGLLGEGLSGRMFLELREKEGLAYEISSNYPRLEGPAHLIMYVVTGGNNLHRARRRFFDQIRKIKREIISEEELENAKRKVIGKLMMERESSRNRAFASAYFASVGLDSDYDRILIERIRRVTAKELQDTANRYLENFTVLIIESSPERPDRKFNLDY